MTETEPAASTADGDAPATPVQIRSREEYETLLADEPLVLLEFVTAGCGICASMEPVLGTVARVAPGAVAMVKAADVPELIEEYTIRSVPTLAVIRNGEEVARLDDGFEQAETVIDLLETHAVD